GPVILAIIYLCIQGGGEAMTLTVNEVALGILTSALMAFVAAGISVVYQIEKLPLMWASFIQAIVLYLDYLLIYLLNGWLKSDPKVILIFTICFVAGYIVIWTMIYFMSIRPSINKINRKIQES
ncbi:MAG: DUF3021 domain-containing protein, partial [Lachnospiraceae bacterium]|nr:DUF3021 domain-containing protein [Lachnospiraceae bacterium]